MRRREHDSPMDPDLVRDLETVDRVLAGEVVDGDGADESWADAATLLRAERPRVEEDWAERLDAWAAAGFPRDQRPRNPDPSGRRPSPLAAISELLDRLPRWSGPLAGAAASLLIVVVVAVGTLGDGGAGPQQATTTTEPASSQPDPGTVSEQALEAPGAGAQASGDGRESAATAPSVRESDAVVPSGPIGRRSGDGGLAPGVANRRVDRDVQMTIAARPEEVRETSDEVIGIARSLGGIVAASQVSETGESAAASIDLQIPTRNLDAALDRLTAIGGIDSLNETTVDITRPFVSAKDRLEDAEAERTELLEALGNATTDEEAESIRRRLRDARREISRAEARFENVARQARWSDLAVSVRSDSSIADERSLSDWLDDATDVLESLAGVLLISAAIILPLAILIAAIRLLYVRLRRGRRERALGD